MQYTIYRHPVVTCVPAALPHRLLPLIHLEALSAASRVDFMAVLFAAIVTPSSVNALQSEQPAKPLRFTIIGVQ